MKHKLPEWLENPMLIRRKSLSIKEAEECSTMKLLSPFLQKKLEENNISKLFPGMLYFFFFSFDEYFYLKANIYPTQLCPNVLDF